MTREQIQQVAELRYKHILLALPTGLGKSRAALDSTFGHGPLLPKVLIVYPKKNLKQNWIDEINKWGYERHLPDITFTTYNSIGKYISQEWDMIIFDEGHHITSRVRDIVEEMKFDRSLILSATIKPTLLNRLKMVFRGLFVYRVRMKDVCGEILPDPRIVLIPLNFSVVGNTETLIKNPRAKIEKEITFAQRNLYKDKQHKYVIPCTEMQYYLEMDSRVDWYKRQALAGNQALKNIWLQAAGTRLKWLAGKKNPCVSRILKEFDSERTLTFCASIEQTKQLGEDCIHSKSKEAQDTLRKFNEGETNHITAVSMLDEGVNLVNCRIGIFANINSSERIQIQRIGRILRHPKPIIVIPYFKRSREEEIVLKMIEGYNNDLLTTVTNPEELRAVLDL